MKTLFLSLLLLPALASAQTTFKLGVRGGANLARTTLADASNSRDQFTSYSAAKSAVFAWQAGLAAEVSFGQLALQPALVFSQKGDRFTTRSQSLDTGFPFDEQSAATSRTNWLELPLNLVYSPRRTHGLQVLAGPYLALGVGGYQRGTTTSYYGPSVDTYPVSLDGPIRYGHGSYYRRFDAGLTLGLGYRRGPAQVQLSYSLGLLNLRDAQARVLLGGWAHDHQADAARNRVLQLTGTYFFEL